MGVSVGCWVFSFGVAGFVLFGGLCGWWVWLFGVFVFLCFGVGVFLVKF